MLDPLRAAAEGLPTNAIEIIAQALYDLNSEHGPSDGMMSWNAAMGFAAAILPRLAPILATECPKPQALKASPFQLETRFIEAYHDFKALFAVWDKLADPANKRQVAAAARLLDRASERESAALTAFFASFNEAASSGDAPACRAVASSLGRALGCVPDDDLDFVFERHGREIVLMLSMMNADAPRAA